MIAVLLALAMSQDPPLNCTDPQYQAEMNQCAARDFERADAELNRLWREVIATARSSDREIDRQSDQQPLSEQVLRNAQRAWVTFRDAHCEYESFEARGGSMQTMIYEGCRAKLTQERISQLRPDQTE